MNITVIVPSLDPDEKLMQVVEGLLRVGFTDILLVNDGSHDDHVQPFLEAAQHPEVTVLTHEVNRGKGRALKTAFEWCLRNRPDLAGVPPMGITSTKRRISSAAPGSCSSSRTRCGWAYGTSRWSTSPSAAVSATL